MRHQRLEHPTKGPVHVWFPRKYNPEDGITVFVHGFGVGKPWYVDKAVTEFALGHKLDMTMNRAAMVAIASKSGKGEPVLWKDLDELTAFLSENVINTKTRPWPFTRVHAIGHSGAYANIALWLGNEKLDHVTLLDSTYGKMNAFATWAAAEGNSLDVAVFKGTKTHKNALKILEKLPGFYTWQAIPDHEMSHIDVCKVGYMPVRMAHMKWVTEHGPMMFFLTRAQMIRDDS